MDELFEVLTLIQTKKITKVPVILVGSTFWAGLKDWIVDTMLEKAHNISPDDIDLIPVVDDPDDIVKIISDFYSDEEKNTLTPNFEL